MNGSFIRSGVRRVLGSLGYNGRGKQAEPSADEYVAWLTFANAGMLTPGNKYSFEYAIRHLPSDAPIVEIGSFCGLSTNLLTYYKETNGKRNRVYTCDKWVFEGSESGGNLGKSENSHSDYRAFVKETYLRNVGMFSRNDLPYTIEAFSDDFFGAWRDGREVVDVFGRSARLGGQISFCYIDGNHSYGYAKRDFVNCDEFLEPGGFVLFDDSGDNSGWGVCGVVSEVRSSGRYEVVNKNPNYLVRKVRSIGSK
jgi:hypothetical protein